MSKYVKNLLSGDIKGRLDGVQEAILVNVIGMDADASFRIRRELREKGIQMLVVKRSLAHRATAETSLASLFEGQSGSTAVVCIVKAGTFAEFELKGGVMDGDALTAEQVMEVSKWPNREEQIAMLVGQILGPGSNLAAQLSGPGSTIAGQVQKMIDDKEE
jgi:ribosomal protein L10